MSGQGPGQQRAITRRRLGESRTNALIAVTGGTENFQNVRRRMHVRLTAEGTSNRFYRLYLALRHQPW